MSEKIVVPVLGESITEATVAKWLKNEGDNVEADEPIVELETDKVNLEVPSPVNGVLSEINSKNGEVVEVGALLGSISENGKKLPKKEEAKKIEVEDHENKILNLEVEKKEPKIFEEEKEILETKVEPLILTEQAQVKEDDNKVLSPAVRKIVAENKIDIKTIEGSGKDGRVLKGDLMNLMGVKPLPSVKRKIQLKQCNQKQKKTSMLYSIYFLPETVRAIRGGEIELHEAWRCYRSHPTKTTKRDLTRYNALVAMGPMPPKPELGPTVKWGLYPVS